MSKKTEEKKDIKIEEKKPEEKKEVIKTKEVVTTEEKKLEDEKIKKAKEQLLDKEKDETYEKCGKIKQRMTPVNVMYELSLIGKTNSEKFKHIRTVLCKETPILYKPLAVLSTLLLLIIKDVKVIIQEIIENLDNEMKKIKGNDNHKVLLKLLSEKQDEIDNQVKYYRNSCICSVEMLENIAKDKVKQAEIEKMKMEPLKLYSFLTLKLRNEVLKLLRK